MKKKEIKMLREKLRTGQSLQDIFCYFFDHFGEDEDFVDRGKQLENRKLMTMLGATCQKMLDMGNLVAMRDVYMIENAEYGILHGNFLIGDRLATYFFFPDMDMGLLGITTENPVSGTLFARFSGAVLPKGGGGLLVVPGGASTYN